MAYDLQLNIPYGSEKHAKIKSAIRARKELWKNAFSDRITMWNKNDDTFRCFVKPTDDDTRRKQIRKGGKPEFVTITVPYSYAILLTAHTYWTSVFLGRNPIFQYSARHGAPEMAHQAVEATIDYQVTVGEMVAPLTVWILDTGKYGIGIVGNYWCEETQVISKIVDQQETFMGMPIPGKTKKVKQKETVKGYAGNKIYNVRPQDWIVDPRVPLMRYQDGEFCGRITNVGWNSLLRGEAQGRYFNISQLKQVRSRSGSFDREESTGDLMLPHVDDSLEQATFGEAGTVELIELCVELSPKDWGLGEKNYPEKWVFTLADNSVVIGAQPLGLYHNKFPFLINLYEPDGYSISPRGMLEIADPLNETMSWLFNTHFYNVRKMLNGTYVVDPSRVLMSDLKEGGPGGAWRLKPTAYGSDVRTVIAQQDFHDATAGHLRDTQVVAELIQRVLGVNDNVMGMLAPGGRKTATEVRTSSSFGVNRLKTGAEFFSSTGFGALAQMMLQNTQQRYDTAMQFKIAGDLITGPQYLQVTPEQIAGFYDFVPVDGTLPVDRFAQANLWKEILMMSTKAPQLAQQYNMGGIFEYMAQLAGLKNIKQFKIQVQPDAAVAQQQQAGNLMPNPPAMGPEGQPGMGMVNNVGATG